MKTADQRTLFGVLVVGCRWLRLVLSADQLNAHLHCAYPDPLHLVFSENSPRFIRPLIAAVCLLQVRPLNVLF